MTHRYTDLRPAQLKAALAQTPLAIVPWGALEWHGPHLPLGLDGLVAEAFATRLAAHTNGVLLPTFYLPVTTLPHPFSLQTRSDLVDAVWRELLAQLQAVGFKVVALVSGHYAQPHEVLLMRTAEHARKNGLAVLAGPPLAVLGNPALLDHAARWETAQLLALRPDLVELGQLDSAQASEHFDDLAAWAVLGEDPRPTATPAAGKTAIADALAEWARWLQALLAGEEWDALGHYNAERLADYDEFVATYYAGDWEAALLQWWEERKAKIK